jgi:hypothetical protein
MVRAHASQSAPLTEWQDSSGTLLSRITANGNLQVGNGTHAAPSISFWNEPTTGFLLTSSGTVRFSSANTKYVQFDYRGVIADNFILDFNNADVKFTRSSAGIAKVGDSSTGYGGLEVGKLDIVSDVLRLRTPKTPASSGASGNQGDIAWDSDYLYVCTSVNAWKRAALATW